MDIQHLWDAIIAGAVGVGGWFIRAGYSAVRDLEDELSSHKLEAARTYSTKFDIARIEDKLDRVLDKLDHKVDK